MKQKNIIPSFDFYKTHDPDLHFVYSKLEESYNEYNAAQPHRHNYYEIILFNESGGIHEIDFNTQLIEKNTVHFISPEQVHLLKRNSQVTGHVISFTRELFLDEVNNQSLSYIDEFPFFNNPYASPVVKLKEESLLLKVQDVIKNMALEFKTDYIDKEKVLLSYLTILLIAARRIYHTENIETIPTNAGNEIARKFKKLLDAHILRKKAVADYAIMLNISAGHLNDSVKIGFGKAASELIHERIILEAKRLLYHSPKSIKEIAHHLQYDDPSYFSRFFKTHTELTPEEFRKHIREKYQ